MPFDYMHSTVPRSYTDSAEKAREQYQSELIDRARLLYRLGYDKEVTLKRLRGNLKWDWECTPRPGFVGEIAATLEKLVDDVYSKPKPPDKGRRVTARDLKTLPSD